MSNGLNVWAAPQQSTARHRTNYTGPDGAMLCVKSKVYTTVAGREPNNCAVALETASLYWRNAFAHPAYMKALIQHSPETNGECVCIGLT